MIALISIALATAVCPNNDFRPLPHPLPPKATSVQSAKLSVGSEPIHTMDDGFRMVGVDMDFWPPSKPKWGSCGSLDVNFEDTDFRYLVSQLSGGVWRLGGSPADYLIYDVYDGACSEENLKKTQLPAGATWSCQAAPNIAPGQCMTKDRWDQINEFARVTGLKILFSLNSCWLRLDANSTIDWSMIEGLLNYTVKANHASNIFGFEFGNECGAKTEASVYGGDFVRLSTLINKTFEETGLPLPVIVGLSDGPQQISDQYADDILTAAKGVMHAVSLHIYDNGCATAPPGLVLNATCLDKLNTMFIDIWKPRGKQFNTKVWNQETSLHSLSGVDGLSNVYTSSFWYIELMAFLATNGVGCMGRQTLIGGDYEMINKSTTQPNPDYWVLQQWNKVVGDDVYAVECDCDEFCKSNTRAYSFSGRNGGGKVVLAMNFALEVAFNITIDWGATAAPLNTYQFTGQPTASSIFFNGQELHYNGGGASGFPDMAPKVLQPGDAITLPPASITFFVRQYV